MSGREDDVISNTDWKTVQFIVERLSYYEDRGYTVYISLCSYDSNQNPDNPTFYILMSDVYSTYNQYSKIHVVDTAKIDDLLENRVVYYVCVQVSDGSITLADFERQIQKLLSNRFDFLYKGLYDMFLRKK